MIGLEGVIIDVEVDTGQGLPSIVVLGLPDAAVQESRERFNQPLKLRIIIASQLGNG